MRKALLALLLLLGLAVPGLAQVPRVKIETVRVGFGNRGDGAGAKANFWAPVYIDLTAGLDPIGPHTGTIHIDVPDADGMMTTYRLPLPSLQAKETTSVPIVGYARPGSANEEVTVTVRSPEGRTLASTRGNRFAYQFRGSGSILYLIAGVRASAMRTALLQKPQKQIEPGMPIGPGGMPPPQPLPNVPPDEDAVDVEEDLLYDDTRSFTFADSVVQLPPHWFGYSAVDLLVLNTGNDGFIRSLVEDKSTRKPALAEWLRRGGQLLISVGRNHQLVNQLLTELNLIGVSIDGTVPLKSLPSVQQWARNAKGPLEGARIKGGEPGARGTVDLAKLAVQSGRGVETLLSEKTGEGGEKPVVVQAPHGLGRVMLIAFDLDTPPFTEWSGQTSFYKKLQVELEPKFASSNVQFMPAGRQFNVGTDNNDAATLLHQQLESFDEVPVISFGWVALFILLYILVVGPLDYFILKKVVKRLELTWITFPTVVLVVSAAAYFTAYYLKGNELRINKVDVVDIMADLDSETGVARGKQVTGTTWFTLFSPRIQSYTVGLEPSPGWVPAPDEDSGKNPYSVVQTWFGRPSEAFGTGGGTPGLFRRAYDYAPEASGLLGVPIQVWATKSFTATWEAGLSKESPLIEAELAPSAANPRVLAGSITNKLPVELAEVSLLYRGYAYTLGRLPPNQAVRIEDKQVGIKARDSRPLDEWLRELTWGPILPAQPGMGKHGVPGWQQQGQPVTQLIKPLLFGEAQREGTRNSTLRYLDQSWRVSRSGQPTQLDEVILIGRPVAPGKGNAETVTVDPSNPSRIWLSALPDPNSNRPTLSGILAQETYVRVFLPVAPKP